MPSTKDWGEFKVVRGDNSKSKVVLGTTEHAAKAKLDTNVGHLNPTKLKTFSGTLPLEILYRFYII